MKPIDDARHGRDRPLPPPASSTKPYLASSLATRAAYPRRWRDAATPRRRDEERIPVAANLGVGGESEVALPALVHGSTHSGVGDYGALIAVTASAAYLVEAPVLALVPYLGSTIAAGVALAVFGALNGFGNVVMISTFQEWAPRALIGRLAALITLASLGVFPISVALAGVVVHAYGPAPFFVFAAATTAGAILVGVSQRAWRDFGARSHGVGGTSGSHATM